MAQPITWQNVSVGSNLGANQLLGMAQEHYSDAFKGLGNIAQGLRDDNLARGKANSEAQLNWFTEQARNLKPEQFTPETMNALLANVTDPAARQAAVDSFSKLGDEITGRVFQQEQRQAFTADEAQKALLRPLEVDKAEQGLKLGEAQIASEKASAASQLASAASSRANTATEKLRTQMLQQQLSDAKTAKEEDALTEQMVNGYGVRIAGGENPTPIFREIQTNTKLTAKQRAKLLDGVEALINTASRLDPTQRKEVADKTNKINTDFKNTNAAIDSQHAVNISKLPIDPVYTQVVGQEEINKKVQNMSDNAEDADTSIFGVNLLDYTDARHVMPSIKKGLDASAVDFYDQLKIELGAHIKDPEVVDSIIAEEMRKGGMYKVQSLALDNIEYDPSGKKKIFKISSDGRELTSEINRMIKPYATTVANLHTRREMEDKANAARLEAAARQANELKALTVQYQQTGAKSKQDKPDLAKSIMDFVGKLRSAGAANK